MNQKADEPFGDPMKCAKCSMALPMANGYPMPTACLKCYPNGPMKQADKPAEQGYDDNDKKDDSDDDDDDEDGDDDEE